MVGHGDVLEGEEVSTGLMGMRDGASVPTSEIVPATCTGVKDGDVGIVLGKEELLDGFVGTIRVTEQNDQFFGNDVAESRLNVGM